MKENETKKAREEEKEMTDEKGDDWFIESVRRSYEEGLDRPLPFSIKAHNWWHDFKRKWFKNWIKEWWDSYKWNHGGREKHFAPGGPAERYSDYMEGVHKCYEREREKERLMTKEEREKYQKRKQEATAAIMLEAEGRRERGEKTTARDLKVYAWMGLVLFSFFVGFKYILSMILSSGWSGIIAAAAALFSLYFFEKIYQKER